MPSFRPSFVRRAGLMLVLAWAAVVATHAQLPGALPFTDTLLTTEKDAIGLAKLEPDEIDALNAQVEREVRHARQGEVKGFAVPFTQRRKPTQRTAAGLGRLTDAELRALDAAVAQTVALPTPPAYPARMTREAGEPTSTPLKPRQRGEVSFTVGMGSGGRSFYGGSMTVVHEDPRGFTAAIQISQYRGKGFYYDDDSYDRRLLRDGRR